jgi:methylenetetrahydrofolate--tRNA-(uracil-5-)-methyltransferase
MSIPVHIVGGGLAGSEAAWQLAERGRDVVLHEMRPVVGTAAHKTDRLAELVCSNTFKSTETHNAHGLLKAEMRLSGSMILEAADEARVAGGSALAVDRELFAQVVTARVAAHPRIRSSGASGPTCRRRGSSRRARSPATRSPRR